MIDETLVIEALNLADGADIHEIAGLVAVYRSVARERLNAASKQFERELRRYVLRKRLTQTRDFHFFYVN